MSLQQADSRWAGRFGPVVAGLLVIVVGYSGPLLIINVAVENAGLSAQIADSWIFTVSLGSGLAGLVLSAWLRQPIIIAFSTPGAVLLSTALADHRFSDAIAAYLVVAVACVLIGVSSTFSKLVARLPAPIVAGMLAGILLRFGIGYFSALPGEPARTKVTLLVVSMGIVYFVARARGSRLAVAWTSAAGLATALVLRLTTGQQIALQLAEPVVTAPTFRVGAVLSLAIPLLALSLSSQYAPGYAVLKAAGYDTNMDRVLVVTGVVSAALAPFGCPGINLAAITAGLATGPDAHPDTQKRYRAGIATGVAYTAIALLGASALRVFAVMPKEFVAAITGLALFGTIVTAAGGAMRDERDRDAAGVAMLCAAGGFTLFHIGAPFWALIAGLAVSAIPRK